MIGAILRRDLKEELARPAGLLLQLAGVLVQALFWSLLGRGLESAGQSGYFAFVAVGGAVLQFLHAPLYALAGGLARERQLGTLDFFLQSRRPVLQWALGFLIFPCVWGLALTLLYIGLMGLTGLPLGAGALARFVLVLLCTLPLYCGAALACGAWTLRFRRGQPLAYALSASSMLLGGVFIRVEQLPVLLRKFSSFAPTYYPAQLARTALLNGALDGGLLIRLLLAGALSLLIGALCLLWSVRWLRQSGDWAAD
jgi:ABC-type polysaccharide/polyol phosphate export permease